MDHNDKLWADLDKFEKVEQWIRRRLSHAVAAGFGQWVDSPASALGKPLYRITDGPVTLILSQMGFGYDGPSQALECRYDEVEAIKLATLGDLSQIRGDMSKKLKIELALYGVPERLEIQLSPPVYSDVSTVLARLIAEWA